MGWRKLGRVFEPVSRHDKLLTHAANPTPLWLDGSIYRIFYSGRDAFNRSSVGHVDLDVTSLEIIDAPEEPDFVHGPVGSFYSAGVSVGCLHTIAGERYLYFMGWQQPEGGHWRGDIGRLRLDALLKLTQDSDRPIMGVTDDDPISLSYPWIISDEQGMRMWYGSTVSWDAGNGEMLHTIRQATSEDGLTWQNSGPDVPHDIGIAQAFSRPTIRQDAVGRGLDMWFSYRGSPGRAYRIGKAKSEDGLCWSLDLKKGLDVSGSGWDSEMVCYPFVFEHDGSCLMLYNGNGYGKSGFGLAVLEEGR